MAPDSLDSSRKHYRSKSDEESLDRFKRHKHRHYRHHRLGDESGSKESFDGDIEANNGGENGEERAFAEVAPSEKSNTIGYDMEEGEIIEDDALSELVLKNDVQPGKLESVGVPSVEENLHTKVRNNEMSSPSGINRKEQNIISSTLVHVGHKRSYKGDKEEILDLMEEADLREISLHHKKGVDGYEREFHSPSRRTYHGEGLNEEDSRRSLDFSDVHVNGKANYLSDDERTILSSSDHRRDGRDLENDKVRERSYDEWRRHSWVDGKDHYRGSWDTREQSSKKRESDNQRGHRNRVCEFEKEKGSSRGEDIRRGIKIDRKEDKMQERSSHVFYDREYDECKERSKDHGHSRERDMEWEGTRERSRSAYRDRDRDTDRDLEKERDREWRRDNVRDGSERKRGSRSDKDRDRNSRHSRYVDDDLYGGGGDCGRSYHSRHSVDERGYHIGRLRKSDKARDFSAREDSIKGVVANGDEDDTLEGTELGTFEQEEEDINRIKEESRRRREAILQKYRTQQLQKQEES